MSKGTGHGGTITFGTSALAYAWRRIGEVKQTGVDVEDTTLAADKKTFLAGDLPTPGEFELEYSFSTKLDLPPLNTPETVTITMPTFTGDATAADLEGDAVIRSRTASPEMGSNQLKTGKMIVAFTGIGGILPVFTPAS